MDMCEASYGGNNFFLVVGVTFLLSPHYTRMKRIILTTIILCFTAAAFASDSLVVRSAVYFDVDRSELNIAARQQLDSMVRSIYDQGECSVSIFGSTDVDGSAGYNQQLSERRAHAVQDYLISKNIKAVKCVAQGLGRKGDQLSKAENRRVDLELRFTYFSDVSDVFKCLSQGADQHFQIDPAISNEIKCRDNTLITIPAGSLLLPNGEKPQGMITLTVREAINTADILTQDLNSVSDGRMLETRGMVYIAASSQGQELSVDPASPISVSIPSRDANAKDMQLFYGARHGDQTMNWKVAEGRRFLPDVKTVPMDLDRSMLHDMLLTDLSRPAAPASSAGEVPIPVQPVMPRQPTAVAEPRRTDRYKASSMEQRFSKRKIERKNEELYQMEKHKYEVYLDRQATYEDNMKKYQLAIAVYNEQKVTFDAEGQRRKDMAVQYFRTLYEYSAQNSINTLIKTAEMVPVTNKTVLTGLLQSRFHKTHPLDQRQQLKRILGDTYNHYYHYDDPYTVIDDIDNTISTKTVSDVPTFRVRGYFGIYDSLLQARHLPDTLAMLQDRILTCSVEMGLFSQKNVAGYVASVSQLGWINCDRFTQTPSDQLVTMKVKEEDDVKMYMVFSDIKSCMPLYRSGAEYISSRIPKGRNVRIVAVKVIDGKPQLSVSSVNTSTSGPLVLQYKTCSLTEIRSNFAAL